MAREAKTGENELKAKTFKRRRAKQRTEGKRRAEGWVARIIRESDDELFVPHCRPPSVNIQASTLAAISRLRRRDTMPEMAVSGADPFRKRPD